MLAAQFNKEKCAFTRKDSNSPLIMYKKNAKNEKPSSSTSHFLFNFDVNDDDDDDEEDENNEGASHNAISNNADPVSKSQLVSTVSEMQISSDEIRITTSSKTKRRRERRKRQRNKVVAALADVHHNDGNVPCSSIRTELKQKIRKGTSHCTVQTVANDKIQNDGMESKSSNPALVTEPRRDQSNRQQQTKMQHQHSNTTSSFENFPEPIATTAAEENVPSAHSSRRNSMSSKVIQRRSFGFNSEEKGIAMVNKSSMMQRRERTNNNNNNNNTHKTNGDGGSSNPFSFGFNFDLFPS